MSKLDILQPEELQEPENYQRPSSWPQFVVREIEGSIEDSTNKYVGRAFIFTSEEAARAYIESQNQLGFSGLVSLRVEPSQGVSEPIEKINTLTGESRKAWVR